MKKVFYPLACCCLAAGVFASCGGQKKANAPEEQKVALTYSKSLKAAETDSLNLPVDENGYITIFDGETFNGWRGYGKDRVPSKWTIEDGCIKFNGSGGGEAQDGDGGDLIFAHKFKNFELEMEWKVSKGGNSGIFYLAQEVTSKDKDGNDVLEPIYISAPEYQVLDNDNHPDAKLCPVAVPRGGRGSSAIQYVLTCIKRHMRVGLSTLLKRSIPSLQWDQYRTKVAPD